MDTLGIEARQTNFENCMVVKNGVNLPNLNFAHDTVWNLADYGMSDAIFCCGLLYHLDRPRAFLQLASGLCRKIILIQTHYSTVVPIEKFNLSEMSINEGLPGRWFFEHPALTGSALEQLKWASWENSRSFWIQREYLIDTIHQCGFDMVFEQYDWLPSPISGSMIQGYYKTDNRCMLVGVRTGV